MAKRIYADVVMNGQQVNLAIRASSEKEARIKLGSEYKGVTEIIDVSTEPPRKYEREEVETPLFSRKKHYKVVDMWTGGKLVTH
jgi:hypothetical protein